jgi:hypothetical protein
MDAQQKLAALVAIIPPERFRQMADWFDGDDAFKTAMFPETWPHRNNEVQRDLRKFAEVLEFPAQEALARGSGGLGARGE